MNLPSFLHTLITYQSLHIPVASHTRASTTRASVCRVSGLVRVIIILRIAGSASLLNLRYNRCTRARRTSYRLVRATYHRRILPLIVIRVLRLITVSLRNLRSIAICIAHLSPTTFDFLCVGNCELEEQEEEEAADILEL